MYCVCGKPAAIAHSVSRRQTTTKNAVNQRVANNEVPPRGKYFPLSNSSFIAHLFQNLSCRFGGSVVVSRKFSSRATNESCVRIFIYGTKSRLSLRTRQQNSSSTEEENTLPEATDLPEATGKEKNYRTVVTQNIEADVPNLL